MLTRMRNSAHFAKIKSMQRSSMCMPSELMVAPSPMRECRGKIALLLETGFVFNRRTIYEPDPSVDDDHFRFARLSSHQIIRCSARDHCEVAVDHWQHRREHTKPVRREHIALHLSVRTG